MSCGCSCGGGSEKTPGGFTAVTSHSITCTLARKLINTADVLRDLYTVFGLRPYRVKLIKTRWSEGVRGRGIEEVTLERILEPTPLVLDLAALTEIIQPVGLDEVGTIRIEQISGRYTEDILRGFDDEGNPPERGEQFFYEIEFPIPGDADGVRRRFVLRAAPMYFADKFQWVITLEKSHEDRARNGDLR
jgi:hypothetical protein